jgi:hypothetical protein
MSDIQLWAWWTWWTICLVAAIYAGIKAWNGSRNI